MDKKIVNEKIAFAKKYLGPAIEQFRDGKEITARHPDTDELIEVFEIPEVGVMVVSTPSLGVLLRMRFERKRVEAND